MENMVKMVDMATLDMLPNYLIIQHLFNIVGFMEM